MVAAPKVWLGRREYRPFSFGGLGDSCSSPIIYANVMVSG